MFPAPFVARRARSHFWGLGLGPDLVLGSPPRKQVAAEMALGTVTANRDGQMTTSGVSFSACYNVLNTKRTFQLSFFFF